MSMSMIGLAVIPGMAVLPTCSMPSTVSVNCGSILDLMIANQFGHAGLYGLTRVTLISSCSKRRRSVSRQSIACTCGFGMDCLYHFQIPGSETATSIEPDYVVKAFRSRVDPQVSESLCLGLLLDGDCKFMAKPSAASICCDDEVNDFKNLAAGRKDAFAGVRPRRTVDEPDRLGLNYGRESPREVPVCPVFGRVRNIAPDGVLRFDGSLQGDHARDVFSCRVSDHLLSAVEQSD